MISYTIGGPDVSIFRLSNDNSTAEPISYPGMSYLTWVVFAVVMSVLFLNLLVSLSGSAMKLAQCLSTNCNVIGWVGCGRCSEVTRGGTAKQSQGAG